MAKGDEWFVIVPRQGCVDWKAVCRVIGKPELETDERFNNPKVRRTNAALLVDIIDAAFGEHGMAHWGKALDAEDLLWAPLMKTADVTNEPQPNAAGHIVPVPD